LSSRFSTRSLPHQKPVELLPAQNTAVPWMQLQPRTPLSDLSISERHGLLIFGTYQATLDALSLRDAKLVFSLQMREPVFSQPVIIGDRLYTGEGLHDAKKARLVAIHLPDGKPEWQVHFSSHVEAPPRLSPDAAVLYGCAGEEGLYSVRAKDGALLWKSPLGHCDSTPLLGEGSEDGIVFALVEIVTGQSQFVAVEAKSGKRIWSVPVPGQPWGTIAKEPKHNLHVFTTGLGQLGPELRKNEKGWVHAINARAHSIAWSQELSGIPLTQGILLEVSPETNLSVHVLKKGEIVAFETKTGRQSWHTTLKSPTLSNLKQIPDTATLVAISYDGRLIKIDGLTGKFLSETNLSPQSTSAVSLSENFIFAATRGSIWGIPK